MLLQQLQICQTLQRKAAVVQEVSLTPTLAERKAFLEACRVEAAALVVTIADVVAEAAAKIQKTAERKNADDPMQSASEVATVAWVAVTEGDAAVLSGCRDKGEEEGSRKPCLVCTSKSGLLVKWSCSVDKRTHIKLRQ